MKESEGECRLNYKVNNFNLPMEYEWSKMHICKIKIQILYLITQSNFRIIERKITERQRNSF